MLAKADATGSRTPLAAVLDDPALRPSMAMVADRAFRAQNRATRDELIQAALIVWAPSFLVALLIALPEREFADADEVWKAAASPHHG